MSNYLVHYGIPDQKWGNRRFQNEDGSLTPAGEQRYYQDSGTGNYSTPTGSQSGPHARVKTVGSGSVGVNVGNKVSTTGPINSTARPGNEVTPSVPQVEPHLSGVSIPDYGTNGGYANSKVPYDRRNRSYENYVIQKKNEGTTNPGQISRDQYDSAVRNNYRVSVSNTKIDNEKKSTKEVVKEVTSDVGNTISNVAKKAKDKVSSLLSKIGKMKI